MVKHSRGFHDVAFEKWVVELLFLLSGLVNYCLHHCQLYDLLVIFYELMQKLGCVFQGRD